MGNKKNVSLGDIAEACGVSRATVSRALHNHTRISEMMRKKIQKTAEELGYHPDPELSRLMSYLKQSQSVQIESTIGVLNAHDPPEQMYQTPYTKRWLGGVKSRAEELGYSVDMLELHSKGMTPKRLQQIIEARGIIGLLVPTKPYPDVEISLDWEKLATVVSTTYTCSPARLNRVMPNHIDNADLVLDKALELGYQRIGLVLASEMEARRNHAMSKAYAHYVSTEKITPMPLFQWTFQPEQARQLLDWIKRNKLDLVLSPYPGVLEAIKKSGEYSCPDTLGYISYSEDHENCSYLDQQAKMVGAAAVDMVSAQIQIGNVGSQAIIKTMMIEGIFIEGATTRKQPTAGNT